jgi:hypothetical protein
MRQAQPAIFSVQYTGGRWLMLAPSERTLMRTYDRIGLRALDAAADREDFQLQRSPGYVLPRTQIRLPLPGSCR